MPSHDYMKAWFEALDNVMNYINSLDTSNMTVKEFRSDLYSYLTGSRPRNYPGETT